MSAIEIRPLSLAPEVLAALNDILVATVAGGERGERFVLGAFVDGTPVGTVSLLLDCPPNQPHRAEIAKMMTLPSHRGRGVATALMRAAEALAIERART